MITTNELFFYSYCSKFLSFHFYLDHSPPVPRPSSLFPSLFVCVCVAISLLLSFVWMTNRNLQATKQWTIDKETAFSMTEIIFVDTVSLQQHRLLQFRAGQCGQKLLFLLFFPSQTYNANNFRFPSVRPLVPPSIYFGRCSALNFCH